MLWTLGASALAGVLAVLASTSIMGRVAGTSLVAAVALALAMPVSRMLESETKRAGGLVGLWAVLLGFVLSMLAMWIDLVTRSWDLEVKFAVSAFITSVGGIFSGVLLGSSRVRWATWTVRMLLPSTVVASVCFLIAVWGEAEKPGETGGFLAASAAAGSVALLGLGLERRPWRWLGVVASTVALALGIAGTWFVQSDDPTLYSISMTVAVVVAYSVAMLRVPLGEARFWTLFASIGSVVSLGACICAMSLITGGFRLPGPELLTRLMGALAITSACSTLAVVVIHRLQRRPAGTSETVGEVREIQVVCPHCGRKILASVGESACQSCGLVLTIGVREPRCAKCDYSLLDLKGSTCPECGTAR